MDLAIQHCPDVMVLLFDDGHIPVQAYLFLESRLEVNNTRIPVNSLKRKVDEKENISEMMQTKRIKLGYAIIAQEKGSQEDMPESQEPAGPEEPIEPTIPEAISRIFGRAMRIIKLTPEFHDCHNLIHDATIIDDLTGLTKSQGLAKLQELIGELRSRNSFFGNSGGTTHTNVFLQILRLRYGRN